MFCGPFYSLLEGARKLQFCTVLFLEMPCLMISCYALQFLATNVENTRNTSNSINTSGNASNSGNARNVRNARNSVNAGALDTVLM